ncbi:hypothetical protein L1887_09951 [Cichorium endivia]|nr:hypothetical protein L1887_09951 [Cichorium endivia]
MRESPKVFESRISEVTKTAPGTIVHMQASHRESSAIQLCGLLCVFCVCVRERERERYVSLNTRKTGTG